MNDDGQQSLLGFFTPAAGVHRTPPVTARPVVAKPLGSAPKVITPPNGDVVFERSHRANNYRLTLRRDGTAVACLHE